jgi:hypothetical protein
VAATVSASSHPSALRSRDAVRGFSGSRSLILTGAFSTLPASAGVAQTPSARIAGEVRVCNIPGHCLTRVFQVLATDSAGRLVARTTTSGPNNRYQLNVPARHYSLLAISHGPRCIGATTALANRTVSANIVCLVP